MARWKYGEIRFLVCVVEGEHVGLACDGYTGWTEPFHASPRASCVKLERTANRRGDGRREDEEQDTTSNRDHHAKTLFSMGMRRAR